MAIVKMSKLNLFSFDSDRNKLLKSLQNFNDVHLDIVKREDEYLSEVDVSSTLLELDSEIAKAKWAIDILSKYLEKKGTVESLKEGNKTVSLKELTEKAQSFEFEKSYNELYELVQQKSELEQKVLATESNIALLEPWENIKIPIGELKSFGNTSVRSGVLPTKFKDSFFEELETFNFTAVEEISSDKNSVYIVIFNDSSEEGHLLKTLRTSGFTSVDIHTEGIVGDDIKNLKVEIEELQLNIKATEEKIKENKNKFENFTIYYEYVRNVKKRIESSEKFLKTNKIDVIEGYVPTEDVDKLRELLNNSLNGQYYIKITDANRDDPKVPIKLKNNKFTSAFESITSMYAMPKYNEIDPTPLFAPFYFIFAGIMVGDIGFGSLMVIGALIALKAFNLDKTKRKMLTFFMYLGVSSIMWGFVFGSFFGDLIPLKAIINPSVDYMEMIMMSLMFGGIHIFFALGIKAYMNIRDRKPLDALFDVGFWYMALIGVIAAIVSYVMNLNPFVFKVARIIMVLGMVGIVLTGGREEKSIAGKIGWGIYSLYGITSYLSDFVSYLRLMALALAGSFISVAINIIVRMLFANGVLGIVVGVIIFVVFQLFNVFLSFLSAYVHTARLTYVEMFNKFYEGGGIPFKSMIVKSEYFNIEEE